MATPFPSVSSPHAGDHRVQLIYWHHLSYPLFHSHLSHHEVLTWTKQEHLTPWIRFHFCPSSVYSLCSNQSDFFQMPPDEVRWKFIRVPVTKIQGLMTWFLPASLAWPLSYHQSSSLSAPHSPNFFLPHGRATALSPAEEGLSFHYVSPSLPLLIFRPQLWCHFWQGFLDRPTLGTLTVLCTFYLSHLSEFSF